MKMFEPELPQTRSYLRTNRDPAWLVAATWGIVAVATMVALAWIIPMLIGR